MTKQSTPPKGGDTTPAPDEQPISLNSFLARERVGTAQHAVLTALHADDKLTRADWIKLTASLLQREVGA